MDFGSEGLDFVQGLGGVAEFFVLVEVAGEGDLVADLGLVGVDVGVSRVGDDFALDVGVDVFGERDLFGVT